MADEIPTIQILDKKNYFEQTLVALPDALPYPPLAPSSLRLRTAVLSLTVNNFTYAALGTLLRWWDVHPLPAGTPAPYDDPARYGRVSAWGYAEVLASTVPSVAPGTYVWGYVPLGTLAQDLEVRAAHPAAGQLLVTSAHRAHVMPIYNRYFVYPPASDRAAAIARRAPAVAHDALLRVMHATAFLMERFVFSADPARVVAPGPGPDDDSESWRSADADLRGATVLIFAPGSKAAALFAALLRRRSASASGARPRHVVGVSSEASRAFVEGTGFYDAVLPADHDDPVAAVRGSGDDDEVGGGRLVVVDFGGRAGVGPRWAAALAPRHPDLLFVGVGTGILHPSAVAQVAAAMQQPRPYRAARVNADDMRRRAIARVGEEQYWAEEDGSWEQFRHDGIRGLGINWGEGMADVAKGWDRLAQGKVLPSEGLVYKL
ncbi:hypothetical protein F4802DRAFT_569145 [Xylaria palmicola]|nr:hypothetical protein F4802DRAFT_569145 [Xylaria palmicola]